MLPCFKRVIAGRSDASLLETGTEESECVMTSMPSISGLERINERILYLYYPLSWVKDSLEHRKV